MTAPVDPLAILRSRAYLRLLLMAAIIGVPISAVAYGFLKLSAVLQKWAYSELPGQLGTHLDRLDRLQGSGDGDGLLDAAALD